MTFPYLPGPLFSLSLSLSLSFYLFLLSPGHAPRIREDIRPSDREADSDAGWPAHGAGGQRRGGHQDAALLPIRVRMSV